MMRKLCIPLFLFFSFSCGAFAAQVTKISGKRALVELKGEAAAPGDMFYAIGPDGKRKAILKISKVSGDKAIADVLKGTAAAGMTLEHRTGGTAGGGGKSGGKSKKLTGDDTSSPGARSYWGIIAGMSMDKMAVQVTANNQTSTTNLSGSAFSGNAFFDYEVLPQVWFRGLGGVEGFNVGGSSICGVGGKEACNATIYYISLDFLGRYVFTTGSFRPWIGGGVAMMFPASKSASALDPSSISNTNVIQVAGGADFFLNKDMFIPFSVEYGMLPKSNEVDASWIQIRLGFGLPF